MPDEPRETIDRDELLTLIRQVRGRWRTKLAVRGAAFVLGVGFAALLMSAYGLEILRFRPSAIIGFRIGLFAALVALVAWFLIRPLRRRVTDEQVALYLEEHEPSLQSAILSAVDSTSAERPAESPALVRRLVQSAVDKCREADLGHRVEERRLRRNAFGLGAVAAAAALLIVAGPAYLRHGVSALLVVSRSVQAASPYRIEVQPGNAAVPKGSDQTVTAKLIGFGSNRVELLTRASSSGQYERLQLLPTDDPATFEVKLFDLAKPMEYVVESNGVRSDVFNLKVTDLPYVDKLELEYHFPSYTGLAPRKDEEGGDIAVVRGTEVRLRAVPTMSSPAGRIMLEGETPIELTRNADGSFAGTFKVEKDGSYRIELNGPAGEKVQASAQYTIDVLTDQPPTVSFSKPGRDTNASPVEEVFVEARADDDFGVKSLDLMYSVNGGPEKSVKLFGGGSKATGEITAGHTFYLEELGLTPGDFVSYYARVTDNNSVGGAQTAKSDLYFMQIRPFKKDFRAAQSQGGGGGGGAGGAEVGALSQQQRQIIAATFNVIRDRKTYKAAEFREHLVLLTLSQSRLRDQVEGLVSRMNSRLVEPDPSFKKIAEILPQAAQEMRTAEAALQAQKPDDALPAEQRALQHLQKAEEEYEMQVQVSRQQGGGGGGGAGSIANDLADLFELELDKMANQYETSRRADQQNMDQQIDELAERLRELARRQEQEAARQARRSALQQGGGGSSAQSQRALADEVEEAARRLEQLARERQRPELLDTARQLRQSADAMRRAAASGDKNAAAEAAAGLDRLREAQRRLERGQQGRAQRDIAEMRQRAEELAAEQRGIASEVDQTLSAGAQTGQGQQRVGSINSRKDELEQKVADLERQLDRTASETRRDEKSASQKLSDAAGSIRDNKVKEKIRYSRNLLRAGSPEARGFEQSISDNLDALRDKIADAATALGARDRADKMADSLDKTRDLVRGLESLDERMREAGRRGRPGRDQQGRDQQGRSGQQGQQGESGQQGQQGQDGQGGQNGEGQQANGQPNGGRDGEGAFGGPDGWNWGGGNRPWYWSGEDARQFRGEIRQWSNEAQELRRDLREQGIDVGNLDEILRRLREFDSERVYQDPEELLRLQSFVVEGLKRFEYDLRRRVDAQNEQLFLAANDEAPASFRKLIEEYYRVLSKDQGR
ncbi:MAG TPA: DUF4175 family protein [Vicinamibacterales bacterium]